MAVGICTGTDSLIHLLVHPDCRGHGIGKEILKKLNPQVIRSKSDQSTGDPTGFYLRNGYEITREEKVGRKENISIVLMDL